MKNIIKFLCISLIAMTACKDSDNNTGDPRVAMLTSHAWATPTVTNDPDGDLSDDYSDFVISFSKTASGDFTGSYTIANGGHAFSESSGKWRFSDDFTQLIVDSGKSYDITLQENLLTLEFTVAPEGGRTNGLSGHFIFELHPF